MKKGILYSLAALLVFGAACSQPAANDHSTMNHNSTNHNGMNHSLPTPNANANGKMDHDAMTTDANASAAPYDLEFIDTMVEHHLGAIEMSRLALQKSQNEELKNFAQTIIDDQQKETDEMKVWREQWFTGKPPAKNMQLPGMADSMKMMTGDGMKKLEAASGREFDKLFLTMMIEHHKGAVSMAKDAQKRAEHAELKTFAGQIIKAQEAEIKKMTGWQVQWSK